MNELEILTLEYQQLKDEEQQIEQELEELKAHYPQQSSLQFILGRESGTRYSELINRQMMYQQQLLERYFQVMDRQININMQIARLRTREQSTQDQSSGCCIQ
jgi:hypothetical protein